MTTIINAIPKYIITAVISTVFYFATKYAHNLTHSKVLHAKTVQSKELWSFLEQVSEMAVNSLVSADLNGNAKFVQATKIVQNALSAQGFKNIDMKQIETAVQSTYEKSDLTPTISTANKVTDPVLEAIKTAPNRANKLMLNPETTEAKG